MNFLNYSTKKNHHYHQYQFFKFFGKFEILNSVNIA